MIKNITHGENIELTGDDEYVKSVGYSTDEYFCGYIKAGLISNLKQDSEGLCTHFKKIGMYSTILNQECIRISNQFHVRVLASRLTENSAEAFSSYLKAQYDAGTPVTIYYKLKTSEALELTEEQKKVKKEIDDTLHTYKGTTHITISSGEINAIANVEYLKDTETEHNKLQNQIDEIKQLLSTSTTSAMLLDNMQTDLESEV